MFKKTVYVTEENATVKPKASGTAVVFGELLKFDAASALLIPAIAADTALEYVSASVISITDALTSVLVLPVRKGDRFVADVTNNSNSAHNEQKMVLTDSKVVNNTGTNAVAGVVRQVGVVGVAADKKIIVEVI